MQKQLEDTYVTQLGTEFKFSFEFDGTNYIIHILEQPGYGERPDDAHSTHRIQSGDGHIVCWTGPLPTLAEAKRRAGLWADNTEAYILHGEAFPES